MIRALFVVLLVAAVSQAQDAPTRTFGVGTFRHADRVTGLMFSADGKRLVSSSKDGTVKIWNAATGEEVLTYRGHMDEPVDGLNVLRVPNVVYSPDGKTVASSGGKVVHLWDAETGQRIALFDKTHTASVRALGFTPDGKTLVTGGDDRKVVVWDVASAKVRFSYPDQSGRIEALSVATKGRFISTVNGTGQLTVYPLAPDMKEPKPSVMGLTLPNNNEAALGIAFIGETANVVTATGDGLTRLLTGPETTTGGLGNTIRAFTGHSGKVLALSVSADGTKFVTGGADRTLRIWETGTGKLLATHNPPSNPASLGREVGVTAVAMSGDGKMCASGTVEGLIRLWPVTVTDAHRKDSTATDFIWSVAVSPDGKRTASAGADKLIRIVNTATGEAEKTLTGHTSAIPAIAFLTSDKLVSASGDRSVKLWDIATGKATDLVGHTSAVLAVTTDLKGERIISGGVDKSVRVWDASGKALGTWTANSPVAALGLRADGQLLAVGTADGLLTLLQLSADGMLTKTASVLAHSNGLSSLAFHPDGQRLLTGGGDGMGRLWSITGGLAPKLLSRLEPRSTSTTAALTPLSAVAISPDGADLALVGSDAVVRLWNSTTLLESHAFRGPTDWVTTVAFTPDGKNLIVGSVDKTVRMFPLTKSDNTTNTAHTGPAACLAISPDGQSLATGGRDRLVKIWNLSTGQLQATATTAMGSVNSIAFTSNTELVGCGDDGRLRRWNLAGKELGNSPCLAIAFYLQVDRKTGHVGVMSSNAELTSAYEVFNAEKASIAQVTDVNRRVSCAAMASDLSLVASGSSDGSLRLWNLKTREKLGADWKLFDAEVRDVLFTSDKKLVISIDMNGVVKIADVETRAAREAILTKTTPIGLDLSPKNDRFAVVSLDGQIKTFTLDGQPSQSWKLPANPTNAIFSPDGRKLYVGLTNGTAVELEVK
jgi:WD40 repeat protein